MKTCPYCGAENRDDVSVCYSCGNSLGTIQYPLPPANTAEPTQPVRTRIYPPPAAAPGPYDTQQIPRVNYPTPDSYAQPSYPPPTQTQAWSSYPPAYIPPPPPPPSVNQGQGPVPSRIWPVLLLGLGALLLFACGFAIWTLSYATNTGANRMRADLATQVAGTFGGVGIQLPGAAANPGTGDTGQADNGLPAAPTPWPTFTPAPQPTEQAAQPPAPTNPPANPPDGQPSPTLDATQANVAEKLLSEGCKTSLDNLDKLSSQIKNSPTVAFDATWRGNLNQAIADMKTNCGTLDAASPGAGLVSQAHQDLAQAQADFDQAGKLFDEGVQNLDPNKLLDAGQHVQSALKNLESAIAEIKKIGR